jgi:hypothetical protein
MERSLAAYSYGGSYGMGPKAAPYSHFIPRETVLAEYSRRVTLKIRLKKCSGKREPTIELSGRKAIKVINWGH